MFRVLRAAGLLSIALFGFTSVPASAAGDLLVAPTRLVLDGSRGTEVVLNNIGAEPATYRISLELKRMTAAGGPDEIASRSEGAMIGKECGTTVEIRASQFYSKI